MKKQNQNRNEIQKHQNAYNCVRQDVQLSDDNWNLSPLPRNSAGEKPKKLFINNKSEERNEAAGKTTAQPKIHHSVYRKRI